MSNGMFTCTIRKISTGYKVAAFCGDSLDDLRNISMTLMRASEWCRCYVVCLDWQGNECFVLQPQGQGTPEPGAGLPMPAPQAPAPQLRPMPYGCPPAPPPAPSWDAYDGRMRMLQAAQAAPAYRAPAPPPVLEAEFEDELRALPPFVRR